MSNQITQQTQNAGPSREGWTLDPAHTTVGFSARHMMFTTVRGRFNVVTGTVAIDPTAPGTSRLDVVIDAASIDTGVTPRDEHLRSPDFLDVERFSQVIFRSEGFSVGPLREGRSFRIAGELTLRDVTREVVLDVRYDGRGRDPWGGDRMGFTATAAIDRRDFGLTWNQVLETGGVLVSNDIRIEIEVQLQREREREAA